MKTLLVFRGPAHHSQLLRPIEDAVERQGWRIVRYTADVEGCFQAALNDELGPHNYLWLRDYIPAQKAFTLYNEHAGYFQGLYADTNPLSLITPQVLDRIILGSCEEWTATANLIKEVKPDACLALHELNRWGLQLGYHCHKRGIPYFTTQEGLYYSEPWIYTGHTRFSRSFVWGEATKRKLMDAGCSEEKIIVMGHPDLAPRFEKAERSQEEAMQLIPHELRSRKLALIFFTNVDIRNSIQPALEAIEAQEEWGLVARVHQLASAPHIEKIEAAFTGKGRWFSPNSLPLSHHWQLLALADMLIIIGCSSTILEWAACRPDAPIGQIPNSHMLRDFAKEGIAVDCNGLDFLSAIKKAESEWAEKCSAKAAAFVRDEIVDMNAAEKIAAHIVGG